MPSYPGSKLDVIASYSQPLIFNTSLQQLSRSAGSSLALVNATASLLNNSIVMTKYAGNVSVADVFRNPATVQQLLVNGAGFDAATAAIFMEASFRVGLLSGDIAAIEGLFGGFDCSADTLALLLPTSDEATLASLAGSVCSSDSSSRNELVSLLQDNINFAYMQQYMRELSSREPSTLVESVVSGVSLLTDLSTFINPTADQRRRRKRQIIDSQDLADNIERLFGELGETVATLSTFYDQGAKPIKNRVT